MRARHPFTPSALPMTFTMPAPPDTFHLFPRLPTELRLAIWRECLPHRVVDLDDQFDHLTYDDDLQCQNTGRTLLIGAQPPVITRVCSEARAVAFETGGPVPDQLDRDAEGWFSWQCTRYPNPWCDRARDTVYRHWDQIGDIDAPSSGDPLLNLLWVAGQTKLDAACFSWGILSSAARVTFDRRKWTWAELAEVLGRRQSWMVRLGDPIIIHADIKTASGLFGLLGDARVQLVDVDDEAKIEEFRALSCAPGASLGSDFAENLGTAELRAEYVQQLREDVAIIFGSDEGFKLLRPVIMFRLCTAPSDPTTGACIKIPAKVRDWMI